MMRTRSIEEAMHIFTQGLRPVGSAAGSTNGEMMMMMMDMDMDIGEQIQVRPPLFRDIASAPF